MTTYMEWTMQVQENVTEVMNNDFPLPLSSRQMATIRRDCNRLYLLALLNDRTNLFKSRCVQDQD